MAHKYKAFISYAHADKAWARSLHARLETFRTPKKLIGANGRWGAVEARLHPIFRDRDELATTSALGPALQEALSASEFLLVLCSPASANSRWVNEEIRFFRKTHGDDRILAAIVDGDPAAPVGEGSDGCFPPALIEPAEGDDAPREPIAADFRQETDGKRLAFLKVAAGMLGVGLDDLVQRDQQRRQRFLGGLAAASAFLMLVFAGIALYAVQQERIADEQRTIAERERDTADASLDYLVSIFEIANPATENPKTITALTILERGAEKIETELADKPAVQAKLMGVMGEVYANLGEVDEAEQLLSRAISSPVLDPEQKLLNTLDLAWLKHQKGENDAALGLIKETKKSTDDFASSGAFNNTEAARIIGAALNTEAWIAAYAEFDKEKAVMLFDDARTAFTAAGQHSAKEIARVNNNQGLVLLSMGRFERARAVLEQAHQWFQLELGDRNLKTAQALYNIAVCDFRSGDLENASTLMAQSLQSFEHILDDSHPTIAMAHLQYGQLKNALGEFSQSVEALKKSYETYKAAYGPENEMSAVALIYLSKFQTENGQLDSAFENLVEAERIYDALYPPDHANHGDLLVYKAITLSAAGRQDEALVACSTGLAIMEKSAAGDRAWLEENRAICARIG